VITEYERKVVLRAENTKINNDLRLQKISQKQIQGNNKNRAKKDYMRWLNKVDNVGDSTTEAKTYYSHQSSAYNTYEAKSEDDKWDFQTSSNIKVKPNLEIEGDINQIRAKYRKFLLMQEWDDE